MCVTSSGDTCHVRERSLFHREKSAKTARIDPAAANPSIARPCEPTICIGSEIQQLSRQPASDKTPADIPHNAPAMAGRVGNARTAISVAINMNGAPIASGQATHSAQYCHSRPGGTMVALAVFVITVTPPTSNAVRTAANARARHDTF